jgi:hypothetical protein
MGARDHESGRKSEGLNISSPYPALETKNILGIILAGDCDFGRRHMKRYIQFIVVVLFCTGCASIDVSYNFDPKADFAGIKTFNWLPGPEKKGPNELVIKQIEYAVNKQLQARGIVQSSNNPDVLISVQTMKERRVEREAWGYEAGSYGFSEYRQGIDTFPYEVRDVLLEFIDPSNDALIWRATASTIVNPNKQAEQIQEIVAKMLENFPPQRK